MGILILEFVTGGGEFLVDPPAEFSETLIREGRVMRDGVALQLAQASDQTVRVFTTESQVDAFDFSDAPRIESIPIRHANSFWQELEGYSLADSWRILLIAPESNGWLEHLTRQVESWGGRLLSPDSSFVRLCADKTQTVTTLAQAGVPIPETCVPQPRDWIVKPRFGCGTEDVQRISGVKPPSKIEFPRDQWHVEPWVPGMPASVSCICHEGRQFLLPPFTQHFSQNPPKVYVGGEALKDRDLIKRAHRIARQAIRSLPTTRGYIGIDILLGDSAEQDVVLEVNPRMTTSWVGLSACLGNQLAEVLLNPHAVASSTLVPQKVDVLFSADGQITKAST